MNSGTEVGTSVDAFALFTYFRLNSHGVKLRTAGIDDRHLHPRLALLGHDLEAQDTILSKVHVSLCK